MKNSHHGTARRPIRSDVVRHLACGRDPHQQQRIAENSGRRHILYKRPLHLSGGQHYKKYLDHALKFLRPGGRLACILPASAYYDHGNTVGEWHDLPVGSFSESGTNIPTGFCVKRVPKMGRETSRV